MLQGLVYWTIDLSEYLSIVNVLNIYLSKVMFVFNVQRRGISNSFTTGRTFGTFSWSAFGLALGDTLMKTGVIVGGIVFCILLATCAMSSRVSLEFEEIFA
jgi:hypothetical protein